MGTHPSEDSHLAWRHVAKMLWGGRSLVGEARRTPHRPALALPGERLPCPGPA